MKRNVPLPSVNTIVEFFLATVNALQSLSFVTMSSIVDVAIGLNLLLGALVGNQVGVLC